MAAQLRHERLAEAHDLAVAAALRVEVGAALAAAHRQGREGVLEHLLERQELPEPAVDVDLTAVVLPRHPEHDGALGLDDPVEDPGLDILGMTVQDRPHRVDHLPHGLVELVLARVPRNDAVEEVVDALAHGSGCSFVTRLPSGDRSEHDCDHVRQRGLAVLRAEGRTGVEVVADGADRQGRGTPFMGEAVEPGGLHLHCEHPHP